MKFSNENEIILKNDRLDNDCIIHQDTPMIKLDNSNDSQKEKLISMNKNNVIKTVNTKVINKIMNSKKIKQELDSLTNVKHSEEININEIKEKIACKDLVKSKIEELDGLLNQNLKTESKNAVETTQSLKSLENENLDDSFTDLSFSELDDFNEDSNEINSNLK